jgi:glycosyltransferase 2 family protein
VRKLVRGVLFVGSVGLALHLVLPQIPGLERSLRLVAGTSHLLVGAAFLAELLSELCYAELLRRSVGAIFTAGSSPSSRKLGRWFMLRLTVTGYGAAHVLPGGGATAAAVTYSALRRKGYDPQSVGLALAAVSVLVYGALGMLFSGSLIYMLLNGDLGQVSTAASIFVLALTLSVTMVAYAAYRRPTFAKNVAKKAARLIGCLPGGEGLWRRARTWSARFISGLGEEILTTRRQLAARPTDAPKLAALALGYWTFDALCLILMFDALGVVADPLVLLVAYCVATTIAAIPLTPGGIGIFEVTMLYSGLVPRPRYRSWGTASSTSGYPYRSPPFSTRHSDALDETASLPVSGGTRQILRRNKWDQSLQIPGVHRTPELGFRALIGG